MHENTWSPLCNDRQLVSEMKYDIVNEPAFSNGSSWLGTPKGQFSKGIYVSLAWQCVAWEGQVLKSALYQQSKCPSWESLFLPPIDKWFSLKWNSTTAPSSQLQYWISGIRWPCKSYARIGKTWCMCTIFCKPSLVANWKTGQFLIGNMFCSSATMKLLL